MAPCVRVAVVAVDNDDRGADGDGAVFADTVKAEALAVTTAVGSPVAFHLAFVFVSCQLRVCLW